MVIRFVVQLALTLVLVVAPALGVALKPALQQASGHQDPTEESEHKSIEGRDEQAPHVGLRPQRRVVAIASVAPRHHHRSWTPTPALPLHPARFSERRLR
ncbi:MAG: hypothetical protein JNL83_32480 [Myxococcales bacterium]|nr:hypothetical protein [Myxococcales bacterium]